MCVVVHGRCVLGHNAATVTRPNCFRLYFSRLKRFSKIHLAVFLKAKLFSGCIFRVKNEIQNSISEFASRYGMPAGDHCGDLADMMPATGTGTGRRLAPPAPARRHRPATGCRPGLPAIVRRSHGHGLRPRPATAPATGNARHGRTDRHRHGKPARVETWQSAGRVAAGFKQKAGNP